MPSEFERWAHGGWIDISRPLQPQIPVWPGDRPFELEQRREPGFALSSFSTTCHVGTHLDAPLHFDETAVGIEGLWLDAAELGAYLLIALPILIEGAEAAPVRAILKRTSF